MKGLKVNASWKVELAEYYELGTLKTYPDKKYPVGQVSLYAEGGWQCVSRACGGLARNSNPVGSLVDGARIANGALVLFLRPLGVDVSGATRYGTGRGEWAAHINDTALIDLDPVWTGVDVVPVIGIHDGELAIEFCFDTDPFREARIRKKYAICAADDGQRGE
jgi:hypothetical protein